jgi:hypothetical protein
MPKMKINVFFMILIFVSLGLYSQEGNDDDFDNMTFNLLYNFTVFEDISNPGESILTSLLTSSISVGTGYHLNVIPNILSPGIYVEGGLSAINLIYILSKMSENENENNYNNKISTEDDSKYDTKISAFGFIGIRLYNQFRFNLIDIQPFVGFSTFIFVIDSEVTGAGCFKFGILFAYNNFCIEYGYHIPYNKLKPIHRIGIGFHFR